MIGNNSLALWPRGFTIVGYYRLASSTYVSTIAIVKKSDSIPKKVYDVIPVYETKLAGTYPIYWDGNDRSNNPVAGDYEYEVWVNNIDVTWGTFGNTSTLNHGSTTMRGYDRYYSLCISGNNLYQGYGYGEAEATSSRKTLLNNLQQQINILEYGTDPNASNKNDSNPGNWYNCTDGINVYWSVKDYLTTDNWHYATKVSDDTEVELSGGVSKHSSGMAFTSRTYEWAFGLDSITATTTGMCTDGTHVFVCKGSVDLIYVYSCATGALVNTINTGNYAGLDNPREIVYDSVNNRVIFFNSTNQVQIAGVGALGALNGIGFTINFGSGTKLTQGIYINGSTVILAIAYGDTYQEVRFFNISGALSGSSIGQIGQTGGYQSTALVANDRFCFSDNVSTLKPYLCFDNATGDLFVGDCGNERIVKFSTVITSTVACTYVTQIQRMPKSYSVSQDMNVPTRITCKYLEFELDVDTLEWVFKRNFRAQLTADYYEEEGYNIFRWITTVGGITYAILPVISASYDKFEWVKLNDAGITYTGEFLNPTDVGSKVSYVVDKDMNVYHPVPGVGSTIAYKKRTLTGTSPNFSADSTLMTITFNVADAVEEDETNNLCGVTETGTIVVENHYLTNNADWHLQVYRVIDNVELNATMKPVNSLFNGWFPDNLYYDLRGTASIAQTSQVAEDFIMVTSYYEGWQQSQTAMRNLYNYNGVPLFQFGTNRIMAEAEEVAAPNNSGNGQSFRWIKVTDSKYMMVSCDESRHAAGHIQVLDGMDSVRCIRGELLPPPTAEVLTSDDLLENITFNATITNVSGITGDNASTGYVVSSGINEYRPENKEATITFNCSDNAGLTKSKSFPINYHSDLTKYSLWGKITFKGNGGGSEYFTNAPSTFLKLKDNANKVIAQFSLTDYINVITLKANSTNIVTGVVDGGNVHYNTLWQWQDWMIKVNATEVRLTYGDYSEVVTTLFDGTADWSKPSYLTIETKDLNGFHYGNRCIGITARYEDDGSVAPVTPYSHIDDKFADAGGTGTATFASMACLDEDHITVGVSARAGQTCLSVIDSMGNTYVKDETQTIGTQESTVWSATNILGSPTLVITVTYSSSVVYGIAMASIDRGIKLTSALDVAAKGSSSATTVTTNSFTTSQANIFSFAFAAIEDVGTTWTTPSGYTQLIIDTSKICESSYKVYNIIQTGITVTETNSSSADKRFIVANYKIQ